MSITKTDDLRITSIDHVINPDELIARIPVTGKAVETTVNTRREIHGDPEIRVRVEIIGAWDQVFLASLFVDKVVQLAP